ncbi:MAG: 4'-phosphopantetheinyl transferase superfamily protein [Hyphomicrobiales bacterium]|nr:4'-phosphopantetheinyl transferase superfamily protein [Hyphomicrobiales bacterium]
MDLPAATAFERARAPQRSELREGWLARRAFARLALARRLCVGADDIEIAQDENGAPFIARPDSRLRLSISGRDRLMAVAIADRPVGVDIEPTDARFDPPRNILHPAERAQLERCGDDDLDYFLRVWTAKEAYLKALRVGLSREPADIEARFIHDDALIRDLGDAVALTAGVSKFLVRGDRRIVCACVIL